MESPCPTLPPPGNRMAVRTGCMLSDYVIFRRGERGRSNAAVARGKRGLGKVANVDWHVCVCVFYYCRTYYKAVRGGGRRRVEDMCYERRRAEACVDESAHHALVNAGGREIV